jgi:hypothetical protein
MQDSGMKKYITIVILFLLLAYPLVVLAAHYTQSYNFTRQKTLMISSIPVFTTVELHIMARKRKFLQNNFLGNQESI